jgi:hypothetical protein
VALIGFRGDGELAQATSASIKEPSKAFPATAVEADNAVRPSELTNDFIALRFVEQVR